MPDLRDLPPRLGGPPRRALRCARGGPRTPSPRAAGTTLYRFEIALSDVDRGVYETLALKLARHPSESAEFLVTRLLAYCLEYAEGIAFSRGLSESEQPALSVRDLTGTLKSWIDIGSPDAARLHKAGKAAPRVVVYTHRDPAQLQRQLAGEKIHRPEALELYALDPALVAGLVQRLERRMNLELSVSDRHLYLSVGKATLQGTVERFELN